MYIPKQSEFKAALHTFFEITYDPQKPVMELKLTKVSDERDLGGEFIGYDIVFEGPKDHGGYLQQGTWSMNNEQLGEVTIFVTPFREKKDCYLYQAVFSYEIEEMPEGASTN
ncbi:hypothetical protein GCM10028791_42390 [Echinicola sediminis]